jgi:hypothetical protein
MVLKYRVAGFRLEGRGPDKVTSMTLERETGSGYGASISIDLKREDENRYKLGQVLTFMEVSEDSAEQGQVDYEYLSPAEREAQKGKRRGRLFDMWDDDKLEGREE